MVSQFLMFGLIIETVSFFIGELLPVPISIVMITSILNSLLSLVFVVHMRERRLRKIEEQLPEVADFISRSLRAGHAFSISLQILVEEMPQPIAAEFKIVSDEINFGLPMSEALQRLCARVPLPDLQYFVMAILIQCDTGGNLADLMTKVSYLIRQRLKLEGDVRVLSAEGRLSAWILALLSPIVAIIFSLTNPDYLKQLLDDPAGPMLLWIVGGMLVWWLFTERVRRRIADIQVLAKSSAWGIDSPWLERAVSLSRPLAKLSLPPENWEASPVRRHLIHAGWRGKSTPPTFLWGKNYTGHVIPSCLFCFKR